MRQHLSALIAGYRRLQINNLTKRYVVTHTMSNPEAKNTGIPLKDVLEVLNKYADLSLAASWDNVGLLIEPITPKLISRILLTNDLTENVVEEAIGLNTDLIISYHPPIFAGMKTVTTATWKGRIVAQCLKNDIAVYSPHTSFDAIKGGVNDWLVSAFSNVLKSSKPIQTVERKDKEEESEVGYGRVCTLKTKISIDEAVKLVKQLTGLKHVKLARARQTDHLIQTIALCAGSGTIVLKGVSADLYLTGEMLHHDVLEAIHSNTHVILTNHSDSERGFLKMFASTLSNTLNNSKDSDPCNSATVSISKTDMDPLTTV